MKFELYVVVSDRYKDFCFVVPYIDRDRVYLSDRPHIFTYKSDADELKELYDNTKASDEWTSEVIPLGEFTFDKLKEEK